MMKFWAITLLACCVCIDANAQVADNFNDGDFTSNPAWVGDDSLFIVTASQLRLKGTVTSDAHISTPHTIIDSVTWTFYTRFALSPSTQNFSRFYLSSSSANLEEPLNGYYVQLGGITGNNDSITLHKQTGTSHTQLIGGRRGTVSKTNNTVRIKVFRDHLGNWELYSDTLGGTNFVLEGTTNDAQYITSQYLGWFIKYSSGNSQNHYLDDVSALKPILDTTKPIIDSIVTVGNSSLLVYFNEALNLTSATKPVNYLLSSSPVHPSSVILQNANTVLLNFAQPFVSKNQYTLAITNVADSAGNVMLNHNHSFLYYVPEPFDILISEFFPDPTPVVGLPDAEFVELYNNTSAPISLKYFSVSDGGTTAFLPDTILNPDSSIIVCSTSAAPLFAPYGKTIGVSNMPSLNNTSDNIILKAASTIIHSLHYNLNWYNDADKKDGGYTIELQYPKQLCKNQQAYAASQHINGGTPGSINSTWNTTPDAIAPQILLLNVRNSNTLQVAFNEAIDTTQISNITATLNQSIGVTQIIATAADTLEITLQNPLTNSSTYLLTLNNVRDCSGNLLLINTVSFSNYTAQANDILISEFMADPTPTVGLPEKEFIELYNNATVAINLAGFTVGDGASQAVLPSVVLQPGAFIVVCAMADTALYSSFGNYVAVNSLPSLNNSGDAIIVKSKEGITLHQIVFNLSWYNDADKDDGGYTIELNLPAQLCRNTLAYSASTHISGGTPGNINSTWNTSPDNINPAIASASTVADTAVLIVFNEPMNPFTLSNATVVFIPAIAVASTQVLGLDTLLVKLQNKLTNHTSYNIAINNVADCSNNLTSLSSTVNYYTPDTAKNYDVLISEIMTDPEPMVGLPNAEYIELHNHSTRIISLKNWQLGDASQLAILPEYILLPDSYVVFCALANASLFNNAIGLSKFPSLGNDADELVLKNNIGQIIHSVSYTTSKIITSAFKKEGGWSMEMIDEKNPCESNNWLASNHASGGTPAKANSVKANNPDKTAPKIIRAYAIDSLHVELFFSEPMDSTSFQVSRVWLNQSTNPIAVNGKANYYNNTIITFNNALAANTPFLISVDSLADCVGNIIAEQNTVETGLAESINVGDVLINEILFNPKTGGVDFIELYNASNNIIDLKKLVIATRDDNDSIEDLKRIAHSGFVVGAGAYPVVTSDASILSQHYFCKNPQWIITSGLPGFSDDEGTVVLLDTTGKIYDEFTYNKNMHVPFLDDEDGVSLERIDNKRESSQPTNWTSAAASVGYATPTYKNSQQLSLVLGENTLQLQPKTISPDGDGYNDVMNINYKLPQSGYTGSLTIYDEQGRIVKQLFKNEILGTTGTYTWNGENEIGGRANVGLYVFYLEVFNASGNVQSYKTVGVVAVKM